MLKVEKKKVVEEKEQEIHICYLCKKEFKDPVIYTIGNNNPVCSWKCLYKPIKREYKKLLQQPIIIQQQKKRGRKGRKNGPRKSEK